MQLELTAWGIFLVRTLKRLTIPLGSSKSYLELGNPLLEEKLGNFSNLSVFSRFFFFFFGTFPLSPRPESSRHGTIYLWIQ